MFKKKTYYLVMLRGENFQLGDPEPRGFYCHRIVEAANSQEAELKAVDLVRDDPELQNSVINPLDDPPMIYLQEIKSVTEARFPPKQFNGYTFFSGNDEDEEE